MERKIKAAEYSRPHKRVFYPSLLDVDMIEYTYRHTDGRHFQTIARNIEHARDRRDAWIEATKR